MLAEDIEQTQLSLTDPRLSVQMPDEIARRFFEESGYVSSTIDEERTRARLRVRQIVDFRLVESPRSMDPQAMQRGDGGLAIVKDLSRTGVGIFYHRQLLPEEVFEVKLHGRFLTARTVRCRRICQRCYEVGGILSSER